MKLLKIKIHPLSTFVTFPKGDMLFGQFVHYIFNTNHKYKSFFENYLEEEPKIIFSDFLPDEFIYKPSLPMDFFEVAQEDKKEFQKRNWVKIENLQEMIKVKDNFYPYEELSFYKKEIRVRNSLNRLSFSTDSSGEFAPYSLEEITFLYQPVIYVLFDENYLDEKEILEILQNIGQSGFGKKGSIGKGAFEISLDKNFRGFKEIDSNYYITLSPTLLYKDSNIEKSFYNTFNRYGKYHTSNTPFKKPLLMADSGAVVKLNNKKEYIGSSINNGIKDTSFVQGYSIIVPIKEL